MVLDQHVSMTKVESGEGDASCDSQTKLWIHNLQQARPASPQPQMQMNNKMQNIASLSE